MTRMQQVAENAAVYGIWTGIVLILLTPFVVTPDTIFPFVVGKAVYSRALIECVFGIWAILALFRPAYRPPRSWLLLLLAVNVGVSVLAACFGVSPQRSFWSTYERMQGVVDLIHWFAFAVVLASVLRTERDWRIVLNLNLGASLTMAVLAIHLYYSIDLPFLSYTYWDENRQAGIDPTRRVAAMLGNALHLGTYTLVNCAIAAGFLIQSLVSASSTSRDSWTLKRSGQKRSFPQNEKRNLLTTWIGMCFWASTLLFGFWTLTLTGSRGTFISFSMIAGLLTVSLFWMQIWRVRFVTVLLLGFFICVSALSLFLTFRPYGSMTNGPFENFMSTAASMETSSLNPLLKRFLRHDMNDGVDENPQWQRVETLKVGYRGFFERPLLGWGPENFIVIFGRYLPKHMDHLTPHDHPHNKILEELTTRGILGLSNYLALWICTLLVVLRIARLMDLRRQIHLLFVGTALTGYFGQSQLGVDASSLSLQYILLLAFVACLGTEEEKLPMAGRWQASFPYHIMRAVVIVGVLTLVGAGLLINQAVYSAASSIKEATDPLNSPSESIHLVKQSITKFEPLANIPRRILFSNAPHLWTKLRLRNAAEAARLLRFINSEAAAALAEEPENRRIYSSLAETYKIIAAYNREYEDVARWYSERALGTDS